MDCNSCGPTAVRKDRPHTFLHHQMSACGTCAAPIEGRVVDRAGRVVILMRCPEHGTTERDLHADARQYLDAFVARGLARGHEPLVFKQTTSTCPTCLKLLQADVVLRDG